MKLKIDFVTNSSSAGFFVSIPRDDKQKFINFMINLAKSEEAANDGADITDVFDTIEKLNVHVNNGPLDWVQKASMPAFNCMAPEEYYKCKKEIDEGNIIFECWIDYNACDKFREKYDDLVILGIS